MAAAKLMHQTKIMILLCLNAVVMLLVGVMIVSAVSLNGGIDFKVVNERSDVVASTIEEIGLVAPGSEELSPEVITNVGGNSNGSGGAGTSNGWVGGNSGTNGGSSNSSGSASSGGTSSGGVPSGQLWSEDSITIYQTADFDICVGGGLSGLGDMYWQTSNPAVIKGFASSARTWLGYNSETCRYPVIAGTGTTTITAGTYDGSRRDSITVTVIAPPIEQWKREVLNLVNQERAKNGIAALSWGTTCESASNLRAQEIMTSYSHQRPDGSSWSTTCPIPSSGGKSGENLNAGNAAVSPETVVASWMNSAEHRKNILDPDFKYLSVGFVFDPNSTHKTYWSQYFTTY